MALGKILSEFWGKIIYKKPKEESEQKPKEDESDDFQKIFDAELKKRLEERDGHTKEL